MFIDNIKMIASLLVTLFIAVPQSGLPVNAAEPILQLERGGKTVIPGKDFQPMDIDDTTFFLKTGCLDRSVCKGGLSLNSIDLQLPKNLQPLQVLSVKKSNPHDTFSPPDVGAASCFLKTGCLSCCTRKKSLKASPASFESKKLSQMKKEVVYNSAGITQAVNNIVLENVKSVKKECIATVVPPISLRLASSLYRQLPFFEFCSFVRKELLSKRTVGGKYTGSISKITTTRFEKEQYFRFLSKHAQVCQVDAWTSQAKSLIGAKAKNSILENVGFIYYKNPKLRVCTATIVAGKVLTAKHCIKPTTDIHFASFKLPDVGRKIIPAKNVSLFGRVELGGADKDFAILTFVDAIKSKKSPIKIGNPRQWQQLLFVGLDETQNILNQKAISQGDDVAPVKPLFDISPLCTVFLAYKGILQHACLTGNSSSGAPIFAFGKKGQLFLIGIQVGHAGRLKDPCAKKYYKIAPNIAVNIQKVPNLL